MHKLTTTQRLAGLDVIRASAILVVILHHYRHIPGCPNILQWFALRGYIGVDLFFVLSGWLIGGQLLRKFHASGSIDIVRFWIRRWFRTLPVYFVILMFLYMLGKVSNNEIASMSLFIQNYRFPYVWLITWSLCVEEHFYLFLPIIFYLISSLIRQKKHLFLLGFLFICFSPVFRYLTYNQMISGDYSRFLGDFYGITHIRLDGLAIGVCLAALNEYKIPLWKYMQIQSRPLAALGIIVILFSTWCPYLSGFTANGEDRMLFFPWVAGIFLVSLGTGLTLPFASSWVTDSWTIKPITFVSEHAYTLYLSHEFCKSLMLKALSPYKQGFFVVGLSSFVLSLIVSYLLSRFIETPGLLLRDWILRKFSFNFTIFSPSSEKS